MQTDGAFKPNTEALPYIDFIFTVILYHHVPLRLRVGLERKGKDEQDHRGEINMIHKCILTCVTLRKCPCVTLPLGQRHSGERSIALIH